MDQENLIDLQLPNGDADWSKNNTRRLPRLAYEDLVDYLIYKNAYDEKQMKAFRSLYAKNYIESKWLGDIYDCKLGEQHFFKASVLPSQPGVGRNDYQAWVAVSDLSIETGFCTCPAGTGRTCSHIAAIAYAVIMVWEYCVAGETSSDKLRLWGRGASKILKHHSAFSDIVYENSDQKLKVDADNVSKSKQFLDHSDLVSYVNNNDMQPLWNCKGTMLNKILSVPERVINEREALEHGCHDVNTEMCSQPVCNACNIFYNKYVRLGCDNLNLVEVKTRLQSSALRLDSRRVRITAGKIHGIHKTSRANLDKVVTSHIYNKFKGCSATQHGVRNEPIARKWLEENTGVSVKLSRLVVKNGEEFLGGSPDGVIDGDTIVEIKCPIKPLNQLIHSNKYDVLL